MPGTILSSEYTAVNKTETLPSCNLHSGSRETDEGNKCVTVTVLDDCVTGNSRVQGHGVWPIQGLPAVAREGLHEAVMGRPCRELGGDPSRQRKRIKCKALECQVCLESRVHWDGTQRF